MIDLLYPLQNQSEMWRWRNLPAQGDVSATDKNPGDIWLQTDSATDQISCFSRGGALTNNLNPQLSIKKWSQTSIYDHPYIICFQLY